MLTITRTSWRRRAWWLVASAICLTSAWAQTGPRLGYAYPAGGRQGTTFRLMAGGQLLRGADDAYVSGEGVSASVIEYVPPLNDNQLGDVWRVLRDLVKRRWVARVMADYKTLPPDEVPILPDHPWLRDLDGRNLQQLMRLRARLFNSKLQPNAQIADQVVVEVTIDPQAPPGDRELRLITPGGATNPVCFQVGTLPEVTEENYGVADDATPAVDLPAVLNGQITPGEVDRFRLRARQGQQLVMRVQARHLMPYLADAVPGWFQPTVALYDDRGHEVAYADDYRFDPDPVLFYKVPADGVYALEIRDAIYRGRDDFVYRIAVGELPFVTQMFPLGGQVGTPLTAAIAGWNLPTDKLSLDTQPGGETIRHAMLGQAQGLCNDLPYAVDALPEGLQTEPNDAVAQAQKVVLPLIVNGCIERPDDVDVFSFEGQAGQEIVAEVMARRLNSPLDSDLRLIDAAGAVLAANDDHDDPAAALLTHQADSVLRFKLPQTGTFTIELSDAQQQGSAAHAYRLRLGPPRPDFAVRMIPSNVNVSPGGSAAVTLQAFRRDGFAGDIDLALKEAPAGFVLGNARIPGDKDSAQMAISAPRGISRQALPLRLEASAQIDGKVVTHPAVPAEDMMQAFAYRHLVPQQELLVTVTGSYRVPAVWRPLAPGFQLASAAPVRIPLGGAAQVQVKAPQTLPDRLKTPLRAVQFDFARRPRGITLVSAIVGAGGVTFTLKADADIAQVGDATGAIIEAFVAPAGATGAQVTARKQRVSLGVLPAITYEIVP